MSIEEMIGKENIAKGRYWRLPWTLISGCTPCSPGCAHCWALGMEKRFQKTYSGIYSGKIRIHPEHLDIPLKCKKPTVWAIWNDLFHEDVPLDFISQAIEVMDQCRQHIFLVLTKRPKRALEAKWFNTPFSLPENIWLGVTACNQQEADEKIPLLLQIPAAVRWISLEPMLGTVDIDKAMYPPNQPSGMSCFGFTDGFGYEACIQWIILGGESGPGARPMRPEWVRSIRDQCQAAGVPFFFKQWGRWAESRFEDILKGETLLDGVKWNELPEVKG